MSDKFQQLAILVVLILSIVPANADSSLSVNKLDVSKYKGFTAFESSEISTTDVAVVDKCPCNGTKRVKSGDGLLEIGCPCGVNCLCGKDKNVKPNKCGNENCQCISCSCKGKECESKWAKRILMFGYADCPPCNQFKKNELPKLIKRASNSWDYGDTTANLIQNIDIETDDGELFVEKYETTVYPTFIVVDRAGKELDRFEGFLSAKALGDLYYGAK